MTKKHICVQTGTTCGMPCYDGCTRNNEIFNREPKETKKTFVEWCREFKTPTKYEFWSMANTGLHISDVSPRGNGNKNIRKL